MKFLVIFAAVVLLCEAAKVTPAATNHVAIPATSAPKSETVAQVLEVSKDHVQQTNEKTATTTAAPYTVAKLAKEMQRKTRAVPVTDNESVKKADMHVVKDMSTQISPHLSMDTTTTVQPVTVTATAVTEQIAVKSTESFASSAIDPCDLLCTKFEFYPICATNGLCLHEFPNQCIFETYNCKHPKGKFAATKDDRCQMHWLAKCDESEMV